MDISSELIMDLALSAVAYLAAGGFAVTVYTMLRNRVTVAASEAVLAASPVPAGPGDAADKSFSHGPQFVPLTNGREPGHANPGPNKTASGGTTGRDRSEIIRVAREMARVGASVDKIRRVLPISETELGLLGLERN